MAGQIKISPDTMRQRAGQYDNEAANVNQVIVSMDNLLNLLQEEWEGESSRSFAQRYTELKPGFQKVEELINEIAAALNQAAIRLEDTDIGIATAFKG